MTKLVVLFDKYNPSADIHRRATLSRHLSTTGWLSHAHSNMWDVDYEYWENDTSPYLELASVSDVEYESSNRYVYYAPCRMEYDIGNSLYFRYIEEHNLQRFADNNVSILFDYSVETFLPRLDDPHKFLRCRHELLARNPNYSGKVLISSCNSQPPWRPNNEIGFFLPPIWFWRQVRDMIQTESWMYDTDTVSLYMSGEKKHTFLCLNRAPRLSRMMFYLGLKAESIDTHGIVSFVEPKKVDESFITDKAAICIPPYIEKLRKAIQSSDDTPKLLDGYGPDFNFNIEYDRSWISNVCFDVITETTTNELEHDVMCITEKTAKARIAGKPFMIVGGSNSLAYLRSLGFRTFPYMFDERYDLFSDMYMRHSKVIDNIKKWIGREDEFVRIMRAHEDDLRHNRALALSLPISSIFASAVLDTLDQKEP